MEKKTVLTIFKQNFKELSLRNILPKELWLNILLKNVYHIYVKKNLQYLAIQIFYILYQWVFTIY